MEIQWSESKGRPAKAKAIDENMHETKKDNTPFSIHGDSGPSLHYGENDSANSWMATFVPIRGSE